MYSQPGGEEGAHPDVGQRCPLRHLPYTDLEQGDVGLFDRLRASEELEFKRFKCIYLDISIPNFRILRLPLRGI